MNQRPPHRILRHLAPWLTAVACAASQAQASPAPAPVPDQGKTMPTTSSQTLDEQFELALLAYERNHWPQAFDAFTVLANQGHANATRMVIQMHRHGPRLYGQQFPLTSLQLQRFAQHRP
jgi:hypothetical protein